MFKNPRLLTLFLTMVVMMIGFGIIIPIMPFYIEHFGAGGTEMGLMMAVFSIMQFVSSPFWGELSDRSGRKFIITIGVLGNAIFLVIMGMAQNFWVMFLARAVGGLLSSATFPTAMAYISDSTTEEERGEGMGVLGAAMGVGMVLGPGIGGWLADENLATPFFVGAGLSLLCIILIGIFLPESLPTEKRQASSGKKKPVELTTLWKSLFGPMGFLLFLAFLVNYALANFEGIFGLYADHRYGYGPQQVGSILVVIGVVSSLVQAFLTGPATRRLGEQAIIKLSLIASAIGFLIMVLVHQDALVLISVGFFVFSNAMLRPSIFSLTSKTARGGLGVALGLNNSFQSLGRVIGPIWAGITFDVNFNLPYLSAAAILFLTFCYAVWSMGKRQEKTPVQPAASSPVASQGDH